MLWCPFKKSKETRTTVVYCGKTVTKEDEAFKACLEDQCAAWGIIRWDPDLQPIYGCKLCDCGGVVYGPRA